MKKGTATYDVAKYLKSHKRKGLNQIECTQLFGATRLSSIVFELKYRHGWDFDYVDEDCVTRYGIKSSTRRYFYLSGE